MHELTLFGDTRAIRPTDGSVLEFGTSLGPLHAVILEKDFAAGWGHLIGVPPLEWNTKVVEEKIGDTLPCQFDDWLIPPFQTMRESFRPGTCFVRTGGKIALKAPDQYLFLQDPAIFNPRTCEFVPWTDDSACGLSPEEISRSSWDLKVWVAGMRKRDPSPGEEQLTVIPSIVYSLASFDFMVGRLTAYLEGRDLPNSVCDPE